MKQNILTIEQVCNILNRDRRTIWVWQKSGDFINPIKFKSRTLGYLQTDLENWINQQQKASNDENY